MVICTIPKFDVARVHTRCLLACFAEERLHGCSLQSWCFNVHAFWKGLIGIFKMIYLVSWDFRMNIKSNIRQIHSGIEVFQKEFSYHFHQLVMYALIIKYDISQKMLFGPSGARGFKWIWKNIGAYIFVWMWRVRQRHDLAVPRAGDRSYVTCSIRSWSRLHLT